MKRSQTKSTRRDDLSLGEILPQALYPLQVLSRRTGLGVAALRQLRRQHGLHVLRCNGRAFVQGAAFIAAVQSASEEPSRSHT